MKGVRLSPYFAEWRSLPCCCCWPILTPNLPYPLPGQATICPPPPLLPDALSDLSVTPIDAGGQQTAELQGQGTSDKPCDTPPLLQCLPPPLCCITVLRYWPQPTAEQASMGDGRGTLSLGESQRSAGPSLRRRQSLSPIPPQGVPRSFSAGKS